ncbi:glycosyltransferase family 2 protein [Labilibacter marinus]|uniref:glycosyltransferase family 2 protein n=1 Tax=Labilibacter marinus TaxID=1477105 RepID=UPI001301373C|nr:glycosyltransferase family 2 protein [Labilibacter marinus]
MNTKPLISIGIPTFKSDFLHEAIDSVLSQTYSNIEIIVVNDQSPEDIGSIVKSYSDSRIRYFVNDQNLGKEDLVANWNKCLSYARGEYFALLCDDDVYSPNFIKEMYELAIKYPSTNVFRARVEIVDENSEIIDFYPNLPSWQSMADYMWHVFNGYGCQTVTEFMYRREHINRLGGYVSLPLGWYSDFLSTYIFSQKGGIASSSNFLVKFRMSGQNITSLTDENSEKKLIAARLYKEAVMQLLKSTKAESLTGMIKSLNRKIKEQNEYVLLHSKLSSFIKLFMSRREYGLTAKCLIKSLIKKVVN